MVLRTALNDRAAARFQLTAAPAQEALTPMPQGKHTRCSSCRSAGHFRFLEVMWRLGSRGPWHYVGGWLCASCRTATLDFIGQIGLDVTAWDG